MKIPNPSEVTFLVLPVIFEEDSLFFSYSNKEYVIRNISTNMTPDGDKTLPSILLCSVLFGWMLTQGKKIRFDGSPDWTLYYTLCFLDPFVKRTLEANGWVYEAKENILTLTRT